MFMQVHNASVRIQPGNFTGRNPEPVMGCKVMFPQAGATGQYQAFGATIAPDIQRLALRNIDDARGGALPFMQRLLARYGKVQRHGHL